MYVAQHNSKTLSNVNVQNVLNAKKVFNVQKKIVQVLLIVAAQPVCLVGKMELDKENVLQVAQKIIVNKEIDVLYLQVSNVQLDFSLKKKPMVNVAQNVPTLAVKDVVLMENNV
jgi:hypothetical protein